MNALDPRSKHDLGAGVRLEPYAAGSGLPMFVHAEDAALANDVDAAVAWIHVRKEAIDALATDVGAVVLRGFALPDTYAFGKAVETYGNLEFGYTAGATPRGQVQGRVYEATRSPPEAKLPLHQEMSYLPHWPDRIAFYCALASETGGETTIADVRRFEAKLPKSLREAVEKRGVRYVRNFRSPDWSSGDQRLDVTHRPWTDAFGTADKDQVEADCRAMRLDYEWSANDSLSLINVTPGVTVHPLTGKTIWFNQMPGMTINRRTRGEEQMEMIERHYTPGIPRPYEITFGDGGPVTLAELEPVYAVEAEVEVAFPWRNGDLMFLDNYHTFHGRNPFTGKRDVQVALLA
jgi:alpha-ketoglutarate-dependent taurine dioxygenase